MTLAARAPARAGRAAVALLAVCIGSGSTALAQQISSPRSLVEQMRELQAISVARIDTDSAVRAVLASTNGRRILAFLADPLCRKACVAGDPSADSIHALAAALNRLSGSSQGAPEPTFPSQAAIINGLTDFIVNRAKDEVSVSFLLALRDRMRADSLLSHLFEQTLIVAADLEARSVKQLLPPMRSAMSSDLDRLPTLIVSDPVVRAALRTAILRIEGVDSLTAAAVVALLEGKTLAPAEQAAWDKLQEKHKAAGEAVQKILDAYVAYRKHLPQVRLIVTTLHGLTGGEAPLAVLARFADLKPADIPDLPARSTLLTLGTLAREYRLSADDMQKFFSDPALREQLLGLIARDVIAAQPADADAARAWALRTFGELQTKVTLLATTIEELIRAANGVRAGVAGKEGSGVTTANVATLTNAVLQIVSAARPLVGGDTVFWDETQNRLEHLKKLESALVARQYVTAVTELSLVFGKELKHSLSPGQLRALTFAATMAEAQTAEQVTAALEAAAVPVTSFRTKRSRSPDDAGGSFGLNAYVGFSAGSEQAFARNEAGATSGYGGLSVPVGVEWSVPLGSYPLTSLSVFVPVLDLGTVASFRLSGENVDNAPSVTFAQVIAPGLYGVMGFTKSLPLSVAFGAQYVPGLRKAANGKRLDTVRFGAIFGVDVPIFHL